MPLPSRPPFDALPLNKAGPPGNAWGLYGADDELGALNQLTPEVVAQAARDNIQTGQRDSNGSLRSLDSLGVSINDDHLNFNTQCSSQWDGFRHFGYQKTQLFYGGRRQEDIKSSQVIGIDAWVAQGGIVGRGVLLDYVSYCEQRNIAFDALISSSIPVGTLKAMASEAMVEFRPGDVLFVRSGFTRAYNAMTQAEIEALPERPTPDYLGVEPSKETLRWLWESGFAAVAGDAPSFEQAPVEKQYAAVGHKTWAGEPWEEDMKWGGLLHQWLLGGWGMPIGEMFDLEELSERCKELGRWTFFVSSVPLNVPGGVASPPNAVAIF